MRPLATCLAIALATTLPSLVQADAQSYASPFAQRFASTQHHWTKHSHRAPAAKAVPTRPANTLPVGNCDDDGSADSLRSIIDSAVDGDTIDLSALTCGTITLTNGAIVTELDDLTLQGPSNGELVIDGNHADSVLIHYGSGTLGFTDLTIANGDNTVDGFGGCLFSNGNIALTRSTVTDCASGSYDSYVFGYGAGLLANGNLTLTSSTLKNNIAHYYGWGGGALVSGDVTIVNSTLSGNTAEGGVGGGLLSNGNVSLHNSTVALNSAGYGGGGLFLPSSNTPELMSTIVSNNTLDNNVYAADISNPTDDFTISGDHNLIVDSDQTVPGDTLTSDPLLQALADNGGATWTLALGDGSPAIDTGSNPDSLDFDQRGTGFARVSGAAADIGAFEVQQVDDDTIFKDGFDGT